ncbi:MAG TPA: helical backbone metal receptor [Candidatus Acidoferrales bacterium]|nr:helical backbone metal receptor [Candidatus Acidoferrales bacterium]
MWRQASIYSRGFFVGGERTIARAARIFVLISFGLVACAASHAAETRPPEGGRYKSADAELRQAAAYKGNAAAGAPSGQAAGEKRATRDVTDETGRRMAIPLNVQHIVTLAPDLTETIYALGLEDKLAGDTSFCDTPPAAKLKPHVGSPQTPSLEAIVAMHPDLVLATTSINRPETADALLRLGIAVYTSDPHTVRGMLDSIARIADLVGAGEKGVALVAKLQARLDAVHARIGELPLVHVLFVVWEDPLITIGQNTFIADALRWAGAESAIVAEQNWPQLSIEEVVRVQPEYIVLTANHSESDAENKTSDLDKLRARPAWKALKAVELGRVVTVSDEFDRPAPGLIGAIEQLARELHPEAFALNAGGKEFVGGNSPGMEMLARAAGKKENVSCAL